MEATRNQTGCFKTAVIMIGSSVAFICVIILLADIKCAYDIENWWAPLYPNGETVEVEYDLFRARALGETFWYMASDDEVETVKQFYRDTRLATLDAGKTRGLGNAESAVHPLEQAVASAEMRLNTLLDQFRNDPVDALAKEIKIAKYWREALLQRLEAGARSLIVLYSSCGI